jgi:hypothetical protein
MTDDTLLPLSFPAVRGKKITAAFDGGRITSDGGVMLSAEMLDLLREWWKVRPSRHDARTPAQERWLFPGNRPGKPMTTRQLNRLFHEAANAGCLGAFWTPATRARGCFRHPGVQKPAQCTMHNSGDRVLRIAETMESRAQTTGLTAAVGAAAASKEDGDAFYNPI